MNSHDDKKLYEAHSAQAMEWFSKEFGVALEKKESPKDSDDSWESVKLAEPVPKTPSDDESGYIGFLSGCVLMGRRGYTVEDARFRIIFAVKAARIGVALSLPVVEKPKPQKTMADRIRDIRKRSGL